MSEEESKSLEELEAMSMAKTVADKIDAILQDSGCSLIEGSSVHAEIVVLKRFRTDTNSRASAIFDSAPR